MIKKRCLSLIFVIFMILPSISSAFFIQSDDLPTSKDVEELDSYLIEGVPYVGQEDNLHCHYASCTMVFNYLDIDTCLDEVIFHSGCAHSLCYPFVVTENIKMEYLPMGGYLISQDSDDIAHLSHIYGFTSDLWYLRKNDSDNCWDEYWPKVKENVSSDTPVLTSVDLSMLPSVRKQFDFGEVLWDLAPQGGHGIVVIGYNESNQTVCYNDPGAKYFGNPEYGNYTWMDLNDFEEAVNRTIVEMYYIRTFKKVAEPMEKFEAFNLSHKRNIERLKGNTSAYSSGFVQFMEKYDYGLGINASKLLKNIFSSGISEYKKIIPFYRLYSINQLIMKTGLKVLSLFFDLPGCLNEMFTQDEFEKIAVEKMQTAKYLRNNSYLSDVCLYDANLLDQEAEKWLELSSIYSKFMKRGFFIFLPLTILLLKNMAKLLEEIITIEQAIIDGPIET